MDERTALAKIAADVLAEKMAQDMPSAIEDPWYAGARLGKSGLIGTGIGALIGKNINKAVKAPNKFKTVRSRGRGALIGAGLGIGAGILGLFGDILKEKKAQRKAMGL